MKILVLSDTHLGITLEGYPRFEEISSTLNDIVITAKEEKVDFVVHCGDVFHSNKVSVKELSRFIEWLKCFEELKIEVRCLTGNHDVYYKQESGISVLDVLKSIRFRHVNIIDSPQKEVFGESMFLYLPFITPAAFRKEKVEGFKDVQIQIDKWAKTILKNKWAKKIYVFSHLDLSSKVEELGSPFREVKLTIPKCLMDSKKVLKIFQGHFHNNVELKKVKVVGSPVALTFAEAKAEKGFYIFRG